MYIDYVVTLILQSISNKLQRTLCSKAASATSIFGRRIVVMLMID